MGISDSTIARIAGNIAAGFVSACGSQLLLADQKNLQTEILIVSLAMAHTIADALQKPAP